MTKLPQPEKHPVKSCRGGSLNAGKQHTHTNDDTAVSSSASGPTTMICRTDSALRNCLQPSDRSVSSCSC